MAHTRYDPAVIQKFADKLYLRANLIIGVMTFLGVAVGAVAGYVVGKGDIAVVGGSVLGLVGFAAGMGFAFSLKLRAQIALCQKQIEENTRK